MYSKNGKNCGNRFNIFRDVIVGGQERAKKEKERKLRSAAIRKKKRRAQLEQESTKDNPADIKGDQGVMDDVSTSSDEEITQDQEAQQRLQRRSLTLKNALTDKDI